MKFIMRVQTKGREFLIRGREMREQRGEVDIGGILLMGIGMVFLAVGFIIYPIVLTACDGLLEYECTANTTVDAAYFTGFEALVGVTPLLVLIGFLTAAVFTMYLGVSIVKGGGSTSLNLGTLILVAISLIFIAIALIILPVALDGICDVLTPNISTTYVGLTAILRVTPLIILVSFIGGAIVSGFFGIKRLGST